MAVQGIKKTFKRLSLLKTQNTDINTDDTDTALVLEHWLKKAVAWWWLSIAKTNQKYLW